MVLVDIVNAMKIAVAEKKSVIHDAEPDIINLIESWEYRMEFPPGVKNVELDIYLNDSRSMKAFKALFKRATEIMYKEGIVGERWQRNIDMINALIAGSE
jgi:hypothetical protein